jgi:Predicted ATPase (AAA+ superfamily)
MIKREKYLSQLIKAKNNGFPKVITGIRRCGKSFLLKEIYRDYLLSEKTPPNHIITIDLDEDKNAPYRDPIRLGEYVRSICTEKEKYYVFLDEIQKVYSIINPNLTDGKHLPATANDSDIISFVDVVLGLSHERNIDLYVTGSNSKMLSSDIITEFRDKATNIHLAPLSFEEFYNYTGGYETEALYTYMQYGGMPLAVLKDDEEKKEYLKGLFETTYFRDIVERNHLRRGEELDELCNIISASSGELLNSERISNTFLSVRKSKIDKKTVEDYVGYFVDAFLLREARRYDIKGRKEIGALRKYYFTDTGLRNARLNFVFPDEGQMIENIVYNELCYNGYSVNVGTFDSVEKDKNGKSIRKTNEVDFYAQKGIRAYYIQVTSDMSDENTRKREIRPYILLNDQIQKIIVVNKPIKENRDEKGFTIIGVTDFLLRFIK